MSVDSMKPESRGEPSAQCRPGAGSYPTGYFGRDGGRFRHRLPPDLYQARERPWQTEQEGHGPLIMLAAAWLAWQQRGKLAEIMQKPAPIAGWIVLIASCFSGRDPVAGHPDDRDGDADSRPAGLHFAGRRLAARARVFAFPLAFLIFSVPPPGWILDAFTVPLKAWVSDVVTNLLYALGYPIAQNGVMIMIGSYELMVKDACSGMNSIFALSAIGVFYIHEFVQRQLDQQGRS